MKKISIIFSLFVMSVAVMNAQTDISKRPATVPGKKFTFPKYSEVKLKNGLKVFVIEDHEQPTITLRLQVHGGETQDKKLGTAYMTGLLLTKGAGDRSALEIAEAVDGVGASISASSSGDVSSVSASFLKKHLPLMMGIFSDVVLRPEFPSEEKDKLMPQIIGELKSQKGDAGELAQSMARKVIYGDNHPYALRRTEESVQTITLDDMRDFHKDYFRPNNASLAVVGDVTSKEIIPMLEKAFADWKSGTVPAISVPKPKPMPRGVYFVKRPAAVQSAVIVSSLGVPYNNQDYETLRLLSSYYGSGFGGRLFKTLRETHSYTYTPFGFITGAKHMNRFVAGAEVRNAVTDSAINVILKEIADVNRAEPPVKDLELIKKSDIGEYLLSFERPEILAMLLQGADFNGISIERLKGYPQRLASMNGADMRRVAQQYLKPEQLSFVVVGNPDVMESLKQFGPVYEYTLDLLPADRAAMEKVNMSGEDIFERYMEAIGGESKINNINSMITTSKVALSAGGQTYNGESVSKQSAGGKMVRTLTLPVMQQKTWVNNGNAWLSIQGSPAAPQEGSELENALFDAMIFSEARILDKGYTAEPIGKRNGEILVKVLSPSKAEKTFIFDEKSFLLKRIESLENGPQGQMQVIQKIESYMNVDGLQLPQKLSVDAGGMYIVNSENSYQLNAPVAEGEFTPPAAPAEVPGN